MDQKKKKKEGSSGTPVRENLLRESGERERQALEKGRQPGLY